MFQNSVANDPPLYIESANIMKQILQNTVMSGVISQEEANIVWQYFTSPEGKANYMSSITNMRDSFGQQIYGNNITGEMLGQFCDRFAESIVINLRKQQQARMQPMGMGGNVNWNVQPNQNFGNMRPSLFTGSTPNTMAQSLQGGGSLFKNSAHQAVVSTVNNATLTKYATPPTVAVPTPISTNVQVSLVGGRTTADSSLYDNPVEIPELARKFNVEAAVNASSKTFTTSANDKLCIVKCHLWHGQNNIAAAIDSAVQTIPIKETYYAFHIFYNEYGIISSPYNKVKQTLNNLKKVVSGEKDPVDNHLAYFDRVCKVLADEPAGLYKVFCDLFINEFMKYSNSGHLTTVDDPDKVLIIEDFLPDVKEVMVNLTEGKLQMPGSDKKDYAIRFMSVLDRVVKDLVTNLTLYSPENQMEEIINACGDQIYTAEYSARDYWMLKDSGGDIKKAKTEQLKQLVDRLHGVSVIGIPRVAVYTNVNSAGMFDILQTGDIVPRLMSKVTNDTEFIIQQVMEANDLSVDVCLKGEHSTHTFGIPPRMIIEQVSKQLEICLGMSIGDYVYLSRRTI